MPAPRHTAVHPDLPGRIAATGLRATPARVAVMNCLIEARRALTHAEVEQLLGPDAIDRVTLYRTLDSFAEAGLVAKTIGADRVARFVPIAPGDHTRHPHFTCNDCGRLYCLPARAPRGDFVPEGFEVDHVDLNVRGRCPECREAAHG
jgi:Fur family ferric uptake transcriptional regulator